jgi:tight adherence protein C
VELLSISLEGGQTLDQALRGFIEICGPVLPNIASAQRTLVSDLNMGIAYERAIARWAENLGIDEAKPLAALFVDSLIHGTELVSHLKQISADLVEQRILTARASIGVRSAQLTAIMVVFFLPAILVFVAAPAGAALMGALVGTR